MIFRGWNQLVTGFPIVPLLLESLRCISRKMNSLPANRSEEETSRPVFTLGISSTRTSTRNKPLSQQPLASPTKPQLKTVRLSLKRRRLNLYALITSNAFASTSLIALGLWQGSVISTLIPRSTDSTIPLITARVCTLSSALARCGRASERQFNEISA